MQQSLGPEASCPDTTRQGDQILEPVISPREAYLRPKSQSTAVVVLGQVTKIPHGWPDRSHGQVTKIPGQVPAQYYSVFCRHQEQVTVGQGWSPHPEIEDSGKRKRQDSLIPKLNKKIDGVRAGATAILPPPPTKPVTLPRQSYFCRWRKKREYTSIY